MTELKTASELFNNIQQYENKIEIEKNNERKQNLTKAFEKLKKDIITASTNGKYYVICESPLFNEDIKMLKQLGYSVEFKNKVTDKGIRFYFKIGVVKTNNKTNSWCVIS